MATKRTALITGSTTGIGLSIAHHLAAKGCNIVLNGLATDAEMASHIEEITTKHSVGVIFDDTDVGDAKKVATMIKRAEDEFGSVDVVVNNAVTRVFGLIEEVDPADWDRGLAVNLSSAFNMIHCAMPGMKARNYGRIVNMSSIYGLIGTASRSSYVTAKTALIGLTRAVAMEVVTYNISCNAVCPGSVNTSHSDGTIARTMDAEGIDEKAATEKFLAGKQPTGRFIPPSDVAELVTFLCTAETTSINGAAMPIDMAWSVS